MISARPWWHRPLPNVLVGILCLAFGMYWLWQGDQACVFTLLFALANAVIVMDHYRAYCYRLERDRELQECQDLLAQIHSVGECNCRAEEHEP